MENIIKDGNNKEGLTELKVFWQQNVEAIEEFVELLEDEKKSSRKHLSTYCA